MYRNYVVLLVLNAWIKYFFNIGWSLDRYFIDISFLLKIFLNCFPCCTILARYWKYFHVRDIEQHLLPLGYVLKNILIMLAKKLCVVTEIWLYCMPDLKTLSDLQTNIFDVSFLVKILRNCFPCCTISVIYWNCYQRKRDKATFAYSGKYCDNVGKQFSEIFTFNLRKQIRWIFSQYITKL